MRETAILDQEKNIEIKRSEALTNLQKLNTQIFRKERPQNKFVKVLSAIEEYVKLATSREEAEGYSEYALEILRANEQFDFRRFLKRNENELKNETRKFIQEFFADNE